MFTPEWRSMTSAGFSHSEIPGSKPVCGSPRLIAVDRVLHRLSAPRHPPCTLSSLTKVKDCTLETSTLRFRAPPRAGKPARTRLLNPLPLDSIQLSKIADPLRPRRGGAGSGDRVGIPEGSALPVDEASGGADRSRTDDLRLARAALSQLSYSPRPRRPTQASNRWWA